MPDHVWYLAAGALLCTMALAGSFVRRLPLSAAMFYLAAGAALGPAAAGLLAADPVADAAVVERVAEVAVIVSLFTAGLKLRLPLADPRWHLPVLLATASMALTVGLIAAAGVWGLGLPLGAAVLLGAVLAPTDPVLAADVQVTDPADRDRVRFGLTGEAGLNDGTAFPFVMLGLGLLGLHPVGGGSWLLWDVLWATAGGLLVGTALGAGVARLVLYLRARHREAVGLDDFLALGLIGLAYGAAVAVHTYGFLAVFAAGLAVRRVERTAGADIPPADVRAEARAGAESDRATHPDTAPAFMAEAVLGFNERVERIGEVAAVVLLGALLTAVGVGWRDLAFAAAVLVLARPLAALPVAVLTGARKYQAGLIAWFGVRGVGSVYYLSFAITAGLPEPLARSLAATVLTTVAVSVVAHGVSVTPLMERYAARRKAGRNPTPGVAGSSSFKEPAA